MTGLDLSRRVIVNIEAICGERGMSLAQVAFAAEVAPAYLYRVRRKNSVHVNGMSMDVLARLAVALDVSPAVLLAVAP